LKGLHASRENVASQTHGFDQDRVARIGFDLLPDAADMNINAALYRSGEPAVRSRDRIRPGCWQKARSRSNSALVVVTCTPSGL
jgi:hypothetical protein